MDRRIRMNLVWLALLALGTATTAPASDGAPDDRFDLVVIDPGHGGADYGARGASGIREKDVVLQVARRIGASLTAAKIEVVFTREDDRFVTLPERSAIANRAHGDLYLSIHANSAKNRKARGPETYFLSVDASDEAAMRVAMTENDVFGQEGVVPDSADIVAGILGDLIVSDHMRSSSEIAGAIQRNLARLNGDSRGVKQAPFVVLMGVNMPAALVEIGFITNPDEASRLRTRQYQDAIANAVTRAVRSYRDARHARLEQEDSR